MMLNVNINIKIKVKTIQYTRIIQTLLFFLVKHLEIGIINNNNIKTFQNILLKYKHTF